MQKPSPKDSIRGIALLTEELPNILSDIVAIADPLTPRVILNDQGNFVGYEIESNLRIKEDTGDHRKEELLTHWSINLYWERNLVPKSFLAVRDVRRGTENGFEFMAMATIGRRVTFYEPIARIRSAVSSGAIGLDLIEQLVKKAKRARKMVLKSCEAKIARAEWRRDNPEPK